MIFASRIQKVLPVPDDPGHEITIQKLTGRHLEHARQNQLIASMEFFRKLGGAAFQKELAAVGTPAAVTAAKAAVADDPLERYDRATILVKGIKAWTYEEPVTPETIDDLSEEIASWLAREIVTLTLPDGKKNL